MHRSDHVKNGIKDTLTLSSKTKSKTAPKFNFKDILHDMLSNNKHDYMTSFNETSSATVAENFTKLEE